MGQLHRTASCMPARKSWFSLSSPESPFELLEGWGRPKSRGSVVCSVLFCYLFWFLNRFVWLFVLVSFLKEGLEPLVLTAAWGLAGLWFIFTRCCRLQRPSDFCSCERPALLLHCPVVTESRRMEELDLHGEGALRAVRSCSAGPGLPHPAVLTWLSGPWFLILLCKRGGSVTALLHTQQSYCLGVDRKSSDGHNQNLCQWSILGSSTFTCLARLKA